MPNPWNINEDARAPWAKIFKFLACIALSIILLYVTTRIVGNLSHTFHTDMSLAKARHILEANVPIGMHAKDVYKALDKLGIEFTPAIVLDETRGNSRWIFGCVRSQWWNHRIIDRFLQVEVRVDDADRVAEIVVEEIFTFL